MDKTAQELLKIFELLPDYIGEGIIELLIMIIGGLILGYITSNKWMRAGYGKSLRNYISSKYDPTRLIDFANNKIFDSATVLVNILSIVKRENQKRTHACSIEDNFDIEKLSDYVETHSQVSSFGSDAWAILSDIEQSIKAKVESIGMPLKEWDIEIFRGVLCLNFKCQLQSIRR